MDGPSYRSLSEHAFEPLHGRRAKHPQTQQVNAIKCHCGKIKIMMAVCAVVTFTAASSISTSARSVHGMDSNVAVIHCGLHKPQYDSLVFSRPAYAAGESD